MSTRRIVAGVLVSLKDSRPTGDAVAVLRAGLRPSDTVIVFDAF